MSNTIQKHIENMCNFIRKHFEESEFITTFVLKIRL